MQIPINLALTPEPQDEREDSFHSIHPGVVLSLESQLKLRSLYDYVDSCRLALDEIRRDLCLNLYEPDGSMKLHSAAEKLERFCIEADSWGFNSLYELALGLQMLLLHSGERVGQNGFRETFRRGLAMIPALLDQCERDFCWRLAIADMLDSFDQTSATDCTDFTDREHS